MPVIPDVWFLSSLFRDLCLVAVEENESWCRPHENWRHHKVYSVVVVEEDEGTRGSKLSWNWKEDGKVAIFGVLQRERERNKTFPRKSKDPPKRAWWSHILASPHLALMDIPEVLCSSSGSTPPQLTEPEREREMAKIFSSPEFRDDGRSLPPLSQKKSGS